MESTVVRISAGLRVGWWQPGHKDGPFVCLGLYTGPDIGDWIVGQSLMQELPDGNTVMFTVGVLFRPDLNKRQRLETILMLDSAPKSMWEYDTWEAVV